MKRDTVKIKLADFVDLIIPNVFTPNLDGVNEFFEVDSRLLGSSLKVYQRTGKKVYESNNYQNKWDGNNLPSGEYFWIISNSCGNNYKGWVSILY